MAGIPLDLLRRLRKALLECEQFESDRKLRSVFAYEPLSPWRNSLPNADNLASRVDFVIDFLGKKRRGDTKENALVLLVGVLSNLIDEEDELHQHLTELADELENALGGSSTTNYSGQKTKAETVIRGDAVTINAQMAQRRSIQNRWALLVGVNRYIDPDFKALNFCVNDVQNLEQTIKGLGYTVVCLHDHLDRDNPRFPTRDNVEAELTRLCETVEPDDLLLVHFACHGKLVDGQPVLITQEIRAATMAKKALQLAQVKQQMRQSKARRLVLTLDACHTGVEIGRDIADPQFIRNAYELAEGFALIAASTAQQVAQEWGEKESGVFTYYLLEGLSGKADRSNKDFVTVDDLKTYVLDGLRRWNVEHGGIIQEPTAQTEGLGDIILADYRDRLD